MAHPTSVHAPQDSGVPQHARDFGVNADRVQGEIETSDGKAIAVAVDIGDKASVETMAAYAVTKLGRIDVLINNAAIFASLQKRRFWEIPVDEWERVMHVNVTGVFL